MSAFSPVVFRVKLSSNVSLEVVKAEPSLNLLIVQLLASSGHILFRIITNLVTVCRAHVRAGLRLG